MSNTVEPKRAAVEDLADISYRKGEPILSVRDLHVSFPSEAGRVDAVRGISYDLYPGKTLGIVGESGSGKSVSSMAIMGLLPESAKITGSAKMGGREILGLSDGELSKIRGKEIAMIFQDPLSSLTPVFTVGAQIVEALRVHQDISTAQAWKRAEELLDLVGIPNPKQRIKAFPHEFSGGMRQRVVIAIAIANDPNIIIADEPTTALDVTIQAQIMDVLKTAQRETHAAVVMITHDMGVIAGSADDVIVMYAGKPVEHAPVEEIFEQPRMPYTIGLLGAIPRVDRSEKIPLIPIKGNPPMLINLPAGCPFAPRCPVSLDSCHTNEPELLPVKVLGSIQQASVDGKPPHHEAACERATEILNRQIDGKDMFEVPEKHVGKLAAIPREEREVVLKVENLTKTFPLMKGAIMKRRIGWVYAVQGLSFDIRAGETLAVVGESGCGKTTTLLEVMGLAPSKTHSIELGGMKVNEHRGKASKKMREQIQMVFQDPMGALDPRLTVYDIIAEPLHSFNYPKDKIDDRVEELMALVGLDPMHVDRFPGHFSGGQRQRIGIARALATSPKLIALDEPVSALDVSIQAGVINLLDELKAKLGLSYLFIAHDLSVIRHISDRVAVMYLGRFVEVGSVNDVFDNPMHPYTQALLSAIPVPDPDVERNRKRIVLKGDLPSPTDRNEACPFRTRCPKFLTLDEAGQERCNTESPQLRLVGVGDHARACHWQ
ncbi:MAG: dipeptide ABC transporter ATP-binding protein [Propionibacteriaceae bacterium]